MIWHEYDLLCSLAHAKWFTVNVLSILYYLFSFFPQSSKRKEKRGGEKAVSTAITHICSIKEIADSE